MTEAQSETARGVEAVGDGAGEVKTGDPSLELVLRPIRSRNLFEETVGRLAQAIELGVIPPEERFPPERELAEMLGVSRVTVREALRALEQAGRVEIRRGRLGGAFVTAQRRVAPSTASARRAMQRLATGIEDLLEYRWAIEPAAASLAATKATESDVENLRRLLEAAIEATPEGFRMADVRIHLAIAEAARSSILAGGVAEVQASFSQIFLAMPLLAESIRHSHGQHQAVIDAIALGEPALAHDAMEEHLLASEELVRSLS
jgi:DNA-binding FadR family transcriptional regulator